MEAVLYIRVSSREQEDGYSQDSQRRIGEEYGKKKDLNIVKTWEVAESAKKETVAPKVETVVTEAPEAEVNTEESAE